MISVLIKLVLLFLTIITVKHIIDIKKFNSNSQLIYLTDISQLEHNKTIMDPVQIDYDFYNDTTIDRLTESNPKRYFLQNDKCLRYSDFEKDDTMIFKNRELFGELKCETIANSLCESFVTMYSFNRLFYGSIFRGKCITPKTKNKNNTYLIGCLNGECMIYLYNPKHDDYINDRNDKKWAIPTTLKRNQLIYIPTNWHYRIETVDECILFHISIDTYFTSLYNEYRN